MKPTIIDVHTHMLSDEYLKICQEKAGPIYTMGEMESNWGVLPAMFKNGDRFLSVTREMLDYDLRIKNMDKGGIDLAIVSLSCPQCFWGSADARVHTAQVMNDGMADAQSRYPDRLRFLATLPWQQPEAALAELDRAVAAGAVGVAVTSNIEGATLTEPQFAPIWEAINQKGLTVLIHPDMPVCSKQLQLDEYRLGMSVGFMFDTTLALARMIMDGFFERYQMLKILCLHGGGTLPFLIGRLDRIWKNNVNARIKITRPPSTYMKQIYTDCMLFKRSALELVLTEFGSDNVLFGSDYPFIPNGMESVPQLLRDLIPPVYNKICSQNALTLFHL